MKKRLCLAFVFVLLVIMTIPIHSSEDPGLGLTIHFIDVGQGDSALIQLPSGQTILIDAGDGRAAGKVVGYLNQQGVTKIDHLIATHPHEDHIGGMIYVLRRFPVGKVYMPRAVHTTRAYEALLTTIQEKGLKKRG